MGITNNLQCIISGKICGGRERMKIFLGWRNLSGFSYQLELKYRR